MFQGQRLISLVAEQGLRVIDSGLCLSGEDDLLTLDSLPGRRPPGHGRRRPGHHPPRMSRTRGAVLREVCFLIGPDGQVLWSDAGVSPVALADSRARWEAIWRLREQLVEIAHSHPVGPLAFSREDETTMAALAAALARTPRFSIVAPAGMLVRADGTDQRIDRRAALGGASCGRHRACKH